MNGLTRAIYLVLVIVGMRRWIQPARPITQAAPDHSRVPVVEGAHA